jgi:hypothetical protein
MSKPLELLDFIVVLDDFVYINEGKNKGSSFINTQKTAPETGAVSVSYLLQQGSPKRATL